ncbi:MAG TPA: alpha/beta family hydrolase [Casimicrobiaceae bacterium]|nr:alpha/beta family hydrolase [Casimicrobiaceae bacterium]
MRQSLADHVERPVTIPARDASLAGDLTVPAGANGIVLFAHGSGSSRASPRNVWVAAQLARAGLATLLFDLLTHDEARRDVDTREHRFDIPLLSQRLVLATDWVDAQPELRALPIGYFGASTGAAAALVAAAERRKRIGAVVSRGGRPDLAGVEALAQVTAATLLVVGGNDDVVIDLNRRALAAMNCEKRLEIVPGATHLFEEPGALEQVATLASQWLVEFLVVHSAR